MPNPLHVDFGPDPYAPIIEGPYAPIIEGLNGFWGILDYCIVIAFLVYFATEHDLTWKDLRTWNLPIHIQAAVSIAVFHAGNGGVRLMLWLWGGLGAPPWSQHMHWILIGFFAIAVTGAVCQLRIFTRPLFGDLPWIIAVFLGVAFALLIH